MTDKTSAGSSKEPFSPELFQAYSKLVALGAELAQGRCLPDTESIIRCKATPESDWMRVSRSINSIGNKLRAYAVRMREIADSLPRAAPETGVVYRKWPGEPPHCMSCDCGMTDEQKRTVPFEDYQTFHTALMAIVYESKSFTEAVKLASGALSHKPPPEKASGLPLCNCHEHECHGVEEASANAHRCRKNGG